METDSKGRKVFFHTKANQVAGNYRCTECGGALVQEATTNADGELDFQKLAVFCQLHPTAEFVSKWKPKRT